MSTSAILPQGRETLASEGPRDLASFPLELESESLLRGALSAHKTEILTLAPGSASQYTSPPSLPSVRDPSVWHALTYQVPETPPAPTCPQPTQVLTREGPGKCKPIAKPCLRAACKLRTPLTILCAEAPVIFYSFPEPAAFMTDPAPLMLPWRDSGV